VHVHVRVCECVCECVSESKCEGAGEGAGAGECGCVRAYVSSWPDSRGCDDVTTDERRRLPSVTSARRCTRAVRMCTWQEA
jgi:hypothetical protein